MEKEQKQVCDVRASKGMTIAQSNGHLRVGEGKAWKSKIAGTYDPTREHLNFEVCRGGVIRQVDKDTSVTKRIREIYKERGIKDPNIGLSANDPRRRRSVADIILQGSRERMRELAYGGQEVDYGRGADNSRVTRNAAIEQWAVDMYNFMARKYGEQNIAAFVVHLDESNPHIHCTLLPITEKDKVSYNHFFGGSKEDARRKYKELHDELAEVNKKYGLARGESVARTGAQHKSYLQWLQERIAENDETIQEQSRLLHDINREVKKAETRLKGLNTMLDNLEKHRLDILAEIELLENEVTSNEAEKEELDAKIRQLKTELQLTEDKIAGRKEQLRTATEQLKELGHRRAEIQQDYDEMQRQINREMPALHNKTLHDMEAVGWRIAAEDAIGRSDQIASFRDSLTATQETHFNSIFDGSMFEIMATRAAEITAVASALFLGYIDQATQYAESAGGGGGPGSGWGRKKDEDDMAFGRRCFLLARNMLTPDGGTLGMNIKRKTGIHR